MLFRSILTTDASFSGLGAALWLGKDLSSASLVFLASRTLQPAETRASIFKLELLAIVFALRTWREYLLNTRDPFDILTDHRALSYLQDKEPISPTIAMYAAELACYRFNIHHIPAALNTIADALSRKFEDYPATDRPIPPQSSPLTWVAERPTPHPTTRRVTFNVVRPKETTRELAQRIHQQAHLGLRSLLWDLLFKHKCTDADLRAIAKTVIDSCETCQHLKRTTPLFHPLSSHIGDGPWSFIQYDLCESLPITERGNKSLLVVYDTYSKFLALRALPNKEAETVATALLDIFATYGVPDESASDLGAEFENAIWRSICKDLKIEQRVSQPYLKRRTGGVERSIRLISDTIRRVLGTAITHWDVLLPSVTFWLNNRYSESTASTPFALMYGRPALPTEEKDNRPWNERLDEFSVNTPPLIKQRLVLVHSRSNASINRKHRTVTKPLAVGTKVKLLDPHPEGKNSQIYLGDFTVRQRMNDGTYALCDSDGELLKRNVDISMLKIKIGRAHV